MKTKIKLMVMVWGVMILTINFSCSANEQDLNLYGYGYNKEIGARDNPTAAPYGGTARYVDSAKGVNAGSGFIGSPWKDLNYALKTCNAGDTIYLRGGIHGYAVSINGVVRSTKDNPIEVRSYPGEWAIFDGAGIQNNSSLIRISNEDWLIFRNLEVKNSDISIAVASGLYLLNVHDSEFHNIYAHHNNGSGIKINSSNRNKFYNCTSEENYDVVGGGNNADGIAFNSGDNNKLYRSVSFHNSDDGFDSWGATNTLYEDCVSSDNGYGANGNGNGFKLGGLGDVGGHTLVRCVAMNNKTRGFDENGATIGSVFRNCIAYNTGWANWRLAKATQSHSVINSISIGKGIVDDDFSAAKISTSLGGKLGGVVNITDFESVNITDMNNKNIGRRFFYPKDSAKNLIDKGTNVGDYYVGSFPDIGIKEYIIENSTIPPLNSSPETAGIFEFSASSYSAGEGDGKVDITVKRTGGSDAVVSVQWRSLSDAATFDADYSSFSWLTLNFASGETSKTLPINIAQDTMSEGNEIFNVLLHAPTNGATLGANINVPVTIIDDDFAPTPQPLPLKYSLTNFTALLSNWLKSGLGLAGDINIDGKVNSKDLGIMMSNWE